MIDSRRILRNSLLNLKVRYVSNWYQFAAMATLFSVESLAICIWIFVQPIRITYVESSNPFRVEQVIIERVTSKRNLICVINTSVLYTHLSAIVHLTIAVFSTYDMNVSSKCF